MGKPRDPDYYKKYAERNKERLREQKRAYYLKNRERLLAKQKEYARRQIEEDEEGYRKRRRDALSKYNKSEKGRAKAREAQRKYRAKPEVQAKIVARRKVRDAVFAGELPAPSTLQCLGCEEFAREYHHEDYAEEHWLDVKPYCSACHKKIHRGEPPPFSPPLALRRALG